MSEHFIAVDRETPMLLPVALQDWLPEGHLVHFVIETVEQLSMAGFQTNTRGTGSAQYPPAMMLSLLIYSYASKRFSSRQIERATHEDLPTRFICGGAAHPDHDTICTFRRQHEAQFKACFTQVLELARELGVLKARGGVSVDGTKIAANASKHAAVSYGRAGEIAADLEQEVQTLIAMADAADLAPQPVILAVPEELARRETRLAQIKHARAVITARHAAALVEQQAEYEAKLAEREAKKAAGKRVGGKPPEPPAATPDERAQYNFTDPDSRIMKAGNGAHFEQAYNAQAAVDTEGSLLILGAYVTDATNDKQQLAPAVQSVAASVRTPTYVLADTGYYSAAAVTAVEAAGGPTVYAAVARGHHHRTLTDLLQPPAVTPPPADAPATAHMQHRLHTAAGRALYKLRKETVEPVFGIIKAAMGFRRFSLRGKAGAANEWTIVALAYNFRRLAHLVAQKITPPAAVNARQTA